MLFQTESDWVFPQLLTTALRTELGATLVIGVETHHCKYGLLPLPVASSEYDEIGDLPTFLPALPRPPAGPPPSEARRLPKGGETSSPSREQRPKAPTDRSV